MFVMRKLIFLLSALLLCAGCDKNEGEPLDMAEQTRINNQFLGLWQEVDHPSPLYNIKVKLVYLKFE